MKKKDVKITNSIVIYEFSPLTTIGKSLVTYSTFQTLPSFINATIVTDYTDDTGSSIILHSPANKSTLSPSTTCLQFPLVNYLVN